jgi:hypothetical protein
MSKWAPGQAWRDVHVAAVLGVRAFPQGKSLVPRHEVERARKTAGLPTAGPALTVGITVLDDNGAPAQMVLVLAPALAAALIAAVQASGPIPLGAVGAQRRSLSKSIDGEVS